MSEREIAYRKYKRELIPTSLASSDTCRLLIVTDDQIEIMSNLLNYAHDRKSWNDETIDSERYYMPSDDDWDILQETVDDLEFKLMSQCDYVILDDANEGLGLGETPVAVDYGGGRALQVSDRTVLFQLETNKATYLSNNLYYNAGWKYIANGFGSLIVMNSVSGLFRIYTATENAGGPGASATIVAGLTVNNGRVGAGDVNPVGAFHALGAVGGSMYWETATLNATPQTILADGSGDCNRRLSVMYTITDKTSSAVYGTFQTCDNNSSATLWSNADCTVVLSVAANGAVSVVRTAGTHDAELVLWMVWS